MEYSVGKIPAMYAIDPEKRATDRERKKSRLVKRADDHDSITISEEARHRSAGTDGGEKDGTASDQPDQVTK